MKSFYRMSFRTIAPTVTDVARRRWERIFLPTAVETKITVM